MSGVHFFHFEVIVFPGSQSICKGEGRPGKSCWCWEAGDGAQQGGFLRWCRTGCAGTEVPSGWALLCHMVLCRAAEPLCDSHRIAQGAGMLRFPCPWLSSCWECHEYSPTLSTEDDHTEHRRGTPVEVCVRRGSGQTFSLPGRLQGTHAFLRGEMYSELRPFLLCRNLQK